MINFQKLKDEYEKISQQLSSAELINSRDKYTQLAKRFSYLEKIIKLFEKKNQCLKESEHLKGIISDQNEDQEVKALAEEELPQILNKIKDFEAEIEDKIFEGEVPDRDIIIEIRSAAGGEEAALFCSSLFKMYTKFSEIKAWKTEILSSSSTEIGGLKEIVFSVRGKGAYEHLRFESGVHRVQRVPITESGGRVHTSTVTVAVLVEPKEVELKINQEDLKIDTFRSSGAGGQHVNVTDSAVRITHLPSGVVVTCQDERSQLKNREKALRVIKARIMDRMRQDEIDKITNTRRTQVGTGERSEKIRTYNFPEKRVTDHRINLTLYRLEAILEGDLEEITTILIKEDRKRSYEAKGLA